MFSTIIEVLRDRASAQSDSTAYVFLANGSVESARLTYSQLDLRARAVAAVLEEKGCGKQCVLLLYPPGLEFLEAFFGCLYSGSIGVPLPAPDNARLKHTLPRLVTVAADTGAVLVLTTRAILTLRAEICSHVPALASVDWLAVEDVSGSAADAWNPPAIAAGDIAYLQYSSGSTSQPKGIMITHANVAYNASLTLTAVGYEPAMAAVTWLPHFHDYGLVHGMLVPLWNGGPCYVMSPLAFLKRPIRWLQAMSRYKAKAAQAPTFGYEYCVRKIRVEDCQDLDLSHWVGAGISAEPIHTGTMRRFSEMFEPFGFRRSTFCPGYGLAEATLVVTVEPPGGDFHEFVLDSTALGRNMVVPALSADPGSRAISASGRLIPENTIRIVDPETCLPCPPDRVGEIWCAGGSIALGYWNQREETERTFQARLATGEPGNYLRTGDLGFIADGRLFVTGRIKDLIILAGANHYPQDIEWTVEAAHSDIRPGCTAAFSIEVDGRERLVVLAEAKTREDELDALCNAIRRAVAECHELDVYEIAILRPGGICKTSSGKVQRSECRARFLDGSLDGVSGVRSHRVVAQQVTETRAKAQRVAASRENIREWLRSRFAAVAGVDVSLIDTNVPLAQYGMTSLEAVSSVTELEDWLGRELSPTLLYQYPTIDALSSWLTRDAAPAAPLPAASPASGHEPIAIVGIACRFPGANGAEAFWRMLRDGTDTITEVPADRWDVDEFYSAGEIKPGRMNTRWGAFIEGAGDFDAPFFGISPREATCMDPQQRILLETTYEALEAAGMSLERIAGTSTGVFVGISTSDYAYLQFGDPGSLDTYATTGSALSLAANRVSYTFDFRGPSIAIDTACSSALTAVHLACESLRRGQSAMALAGGVNLILTPELTIAASQAGMMSADGHCQTFDSRANGYVRGEGCGVVVLKRLTDAIRDKDPITAVIRGIAVNQDGRSNGLTAPNPLQQQQVIQLALLDAGVSPCDVDYVEAHGTGTSLGDPIEVQALSETLGRDRDPGHPCLIGSVKTNVGHLEAAAGLAGLIKVALALSHEQIPPHRGLNQINPYIKLEGSGLEIATRLTEWTRNGKPRRAGISSFGVGGANAHAILEEAPATPVPEFQAAQLNEHRPLHLLTISAKTRPAFLDLLKRYEEQLQSDGRFAEISFTSNAGRSHFAHRAALVAGASEDARLKLRAFLDGNSAALHLGVADANSRPRIAFLFGDRAAGYGQQGATVFQADAFTEALHECSKILKRELGICHISSEAVLSGPELFAFQWASAQLWKSWGIEPDAMIGLGSGEYVAECVKGAMSLEDGLNLALAARDLPNSAATSCASSIQALSTQGIRVFLQMGTDPDLAAFVGGCLPPESVVLPASTNGTIEQGFLENLGELYVRGASLDWDVLAKDCASPKVNLPAYPFQRRRYWLDSPRKARASSRVPPNGEPVHVALVHPLLGRTLRSPALKHTVFEAELSPWSPPFLGDHIVYGRPVVPASAFLEMALAAPGGEWPYQLRDCDIKEALVLRENGGPVTVQTIVNSDPGQRNTFRIVSLGDDGESWRLHATGEILRDSAATIPEKIILVDIQARCKERLSGADLYAFLKRFHLDYGPAFQGVADVWRRKGEALGRIRQPALKAFGPFVMNPALADACFHVIVAAHEYEGIDEAYVPMHIGALDVRSPLPEEFWVRAVVRSSGPRHSGVVSADVDLFDEAGTVFARFTKLTCMRIGREKLLGAAAKDDYRDWLYQLTWQTKESDFIEGQLDSGQWLILADRGSVGEALAGILESQGQRVICALTEEELVIRSITDLPLRGVIHLWALDENCGQSRICGAVLRLVKAVAEAHLETRPRLCLVTRGTQFIDLPGVDLAASDLPAADGNNTAAPPAGAPLWGFANVLTVEHPDLRPVIVDLDSQPGINEALFIAEELLTSDGEARVALRKGLRHVQRLARIKPPDTPPEKPSLKPEATYLITGGLGAIGLKVASWMVERGARRLVLASRTSPSGDAQEAVEALRESGAEVLVSQVDVGDPGAVADMMARIENSTMPLRGIMHAAGVLDDGVCVHQDWDRFQAVLRPKVQGAWNLHVHSLHIPLDFFVMFSSASTFMPNTGQASYAAGNAFLDSLAHLRSRLGLAALCVNWGLWEGPGLGTGSEAHQKFAAYGVGVINPVQGLRALDFALHRQHAQAGEGAQCVVLPIDWSKYFSHFRDGAEPRLLSKLADDVRGRMEDDALQQRRSELLGRLEQASKTERQEYIEDFIADQVADVLGYASRAEVDFSVGFFEIGLDSMMAVELQSRIQTGLGISIPSTTTFDQPNITALARYLLDNFLVFETKSPAPAVGALDSMFDEPVFTFGENPQEEPASTSRKAQ